MVKDTRRLCTHGRRDLALGAGRLGAGQCNASSSARLSGERPRPHRGAHSRAPGPSLSRALAAVPSASRLLVGLLPGLRMGVGFPLGPSGLRPTAYVLPPDAIKHSRAGPSAATREAATRGQRAGRRRSPRRATGAATRPLFVDGPLGVGLSSCTRCCHRAARSRASRADSSPRASRRSACAATASASAAMAANSSSRFNAPEPPVADYPTADASKPRRPGRPPGSSTSDSGGRRHAITRGDARAANAPASGLHG
jgi:hypothetical protein